MRFGWAQVVVGVGLVACAAWLGGAAWALAWPALAVTAVGCGYLGLGPGVFGKRPDGSLRAPCYALLLPYHVVARLRIRWDAWRRREPAWNEVAPGLFLGRYVEADRLPPGTRVVVDLTSELAAPAGTRDGRDYHCLPALDASVPRYDDFARLVRALADHEGPIYVHCAAGHGRSATFAAALLVARGHARGVDDAEAMLRSARPAVRLHPPQRALVHRFVEEHRAARGREPGAA